MDDLLRDAKKIPEDRFDVKSIAWDMILHLVLQRLMEGREILFPLSLQGRYMFSQMLS